VGGLGPHELIATNLAFTINSLAFIPMMGMSMAVTTLVGQRLGQNEPELAARGTWTAYEMATLYMGAISLLYLLAPHMFLIPHQAGMDPGEFGALRDLTTVLLRFVAAYCLFDTMILVFVGALKGAGDTRFILFASLAMAPVPVLFTWLGTRVFGQGLLFSWVTITCWVCGLGTIYLIRFLQGKWRSMRVIEHAPPDLYTVGLDDAPTEEPAVAM
jgi:MATE family multidrug resistance protein